MTGLEAALIGAGIKEVAGPAKSLIARLGRAGYEQLVVTYTKCFQGHVDAALERCSRIKNILYKDQSVLLKDQYVNVSFQHNKSSISDKEAIELVTHGKKFLVSGTAGAGKTMFMKWATISTIESIPHHQLIPLFLELRYISRDDAEQGILPYILRTTSEASASVTLDRFQLGLEAGQFILILDAVDEVNPEFREKIVADIRELIRSYPKCPVVISTRPDDSLESLQDIEVLRTKPMSRQQIIEVIDKLDYDASVKGSLVSQLKAGLFEKHQEFLSNPLLATIMLLTFDHSADIPTKLTSFYRQAFEVLYQRHDAAKGAYRRGHHAGLPLDEYEAVFAVFCYQSYLASKVEFTDSELLSQFRRAADYKELKIDPRLLVRDAMESVCLIQKEGLDNVFVHKSFQEYFTAVFIASYRGPNVKDLIDAVAINLHSGNVLRMLMELSPDLLEFEWILSKTTEWLSKVNRLKIDTVSGFRRFFQATYSSLDFDPDDGTVISFGLDLGTGARWMSAVEAAYGSRKLSNLIFDGSTPAFKNLEALLTDPILKDLPSVRAIAKNVRPAPEFESGDLEVSADPSDADWLIRTDIVRRFETLREEVRRLHSEINSRREGRRTSVQRLIEPD